MIGTHSDEEVHDSCRREHCRAAASRHFFKCAHDLDALTPFGQRDDRRRLRIEQLRFRVALHAHEHCAIHTC